mmetsp:Transcript_4871/g.12145  ORF Transcript_4871/g.12145 Transcript_4871/m.12145 type:complete len:208 (-) Transcript_4871:1855-2478(-)
MVFLLERRESFDESASSRQNICMRWYLLRLEGVNAGHVRLGKFSQREASQRSTMPFWTDGRTVVSPSTSQENRLLANLTNPFGMGSASFSMINRAMSLGRLCSGLVACRMPEKKIASTSTSRHTPRSFRAQSMNELAHKCSRMARGNAVLSNPGRSMYSREALAFMESSSAVKRSPVFSISFAFSPKMRFSRVVFSESAFSMSTTTW